LSCLRNHSFAGSAIRTGRPDSKRPLAGEDGVAARLRAARLPARMLSG
jgi:hypothetical protein